MITRLLMDFIAALINLITGLLPTSGPPAWWTSVSGTIADVWTYGAGLGAWFPWQLAAVCVPAIFGAMAIGFGIRLIRIVASLFTGGGGSAA